MNRHATDVRRRDSRRGRHRHFVRPASVFQGSNEVVEEVGFTDSGGAGEEGVGSGEYSGGGGGLIGVER